MSEKKGCWDVVVLIWPLGILGIAFVGLVLWRLNEFKANTLQGLLIISLVVVPLGVINVWFGLTAGKTIIEAPVVIDQEQSPRLHVLFRYVRLIGGLILLAIIGMAWIRYLV